MYSQAITVLCLFIAGPLFANGMPSETNSSILESLGIDPDSVSEHEFVEINIPEKLYKRDVKSETPVMVQALGMEFELLLRPQHSRFISDETPVYWASSTPGKNGGVSYEKIPDAMKAVRRILMDPKHDVTVLVGKNPTEKTTINGQLRDPKTNTRVIIKEVPKPISGKHVRSRRRVGDCNDDSNDKSYHIVAKLKDPAPTKPISSNIPKVGTTRKVISTPAASLPGSVKPSDKKIPDILYPQILVEVDSTFQPELKSMGMTRFLEYLAALWNAAGMVYLDIPQPMIRINIAGIIIAKDAKATPFIADNQGEPGAFDHQTALRQSMKFHFNLENVFSFDSYDLITTMTKLKMGKNGYYGAVGLAVAGGVCGVYRGQSEIHSVSLVQDNGAFSGILTAAHEIGHLFGFYHDDENEGDDCAIEEGYVMAHVSVISPNLSWFSKCSLAKLKKNWLDGKFECMYNVPSKTGVELPKVIPGRLKSLEEQCAARGRGPPCFLGEKNVCVELWCQDLNNPTSCDTNLEGAAPGSPCGPQNATKPMVCLKSRCVEVKKGF